MNHRSIILLVLIVALAALPMQAASEPEQFAWAWPLEAEQTRDLWRLRLPVELVESLHLADASDLSIVDSRGRPVSFARIDDAHLIEPLHSSQTLEHHSSRTLTAEPEAGVLELILQQGDTRMVLRSPQPGTAPDSRGRLLFEALLAAPEVALTWSRHQLVIALDSQHLLDLDCWLKDADEPGPAQQRAGFRQLGDSRPRRFESRIEIDSLPTAWYLACYGNRAVPEDLVLSQARLDSHGRHDHRQQESLEQMLKVDQATPGTFEFETTGPFRARSISLSSSYGSQLSELIIESKGEAFRGQPEQGWQQRARAVFSTLGDAREMTIALEHAERRDRLWRIRSEPPLVEAPSTRLAVELEELAFLAQGEPPWQLLGGSLNSGPIQAGRRILDSGQTEFGPAWAWPLIEAGQRQVAGGPEVLVPRPDPLPWSRYLLWTILMLAAGLVVWLAVGLLRQTD